MYITTTVRFTAYIGKIQTSSGLSVLEKNFFRSNRFHPGLKYQPSVRSQR